MTWKPVKRIGSRRLIGSTLAWAVVAGALCRGDSVIMKNGIVYRGQGAPDRDNTLVFISDGLKRVVVRDSKIERIEANNAFRTGEKFQLVQPMSVHGGIMPEEVVSVQATPWDGSGRRSFNYVEPGSTRPSEWNRRSSRLARTSRGFAASTDFGLARSRRTRSRQSVMNSWAASSRITSRSANAWFGFSWISAGSPRPNRNSTASSRTFPTPI